MSFCFRSLVYPVGKKCRLILEPEFPVKVDGEAEYSVTLTPFSGLKFYKTGLDPACAEFFAATHVLEKKDGALQMDVVFPQEDSYVAWLYLGETLLDKLEVYAVEDDLFALTPYKGDNHMHSYMSDGKESPMYMAASCCQRGCDYCVITDHWHYEPSIITREFYEGTGVDFLVIPGEEVHSPDNPVHIINLGGTFSVNKWWKPDDSEYRQAVKEEMNNVDPAMAEKDRFAAAASQVVFDRIHQANGVAILCHPHWILEKGFNQHEDITAFLIDNKRFDVLELIAGGAFEVGTQMQISYYQELDKMPIVGSSDAHSTFGGRLEPGNYTIVFAEELTTESIRESIRAGRTVAGFENKLYGDYRLMKYAYFLRRWYFPKHEQQRAALGRSMLRFASAQAGKDSEFAEKLKQPRPSELFAALRAPVEE